MFDRDEDANKAWRLFIAIELPLRTRQRIKQHIERLRVALPDVRASWIREENIHLTLKFLGDTPVDKVEALSQAVRRAASELTPFEIRIVGCGSFPPYGKPKVLWVGINDLSTGLAKLHAALESECAQSGFARENRSFHPHLTIARLRSPHGARRLAALHDELGFEPVPVRVEDVCLIRSELSSEGSRYAIVARHPVRST